MIAVVCLSTNPDLAFYARLYFDVARTIEPRSLFVHNVHTPPASDSCLVGSTTKHVGGDWRFLTDAFKVPAIVREMRRRNIGLVHFASAHPGNLLLAAACKLAGIKVVMSVHDPEPHPGRWSLAIAAYNFCTRLVANDFVAYSQPDASSWLTNRRMHSLKLGGFALSVGEPKTGADAVLFFGRIEPYKGLRHIVTMACRAQSRIPGLRFIVAGAGDDEALTSLRHLPNVVLLNRFVEEAELRDLFLQSRFCIAPYDSATQSGVVVLSLAHATPVIAFDVGGIKEYLRDGKTGRLFEPADAEGVVEYLATVAESDVRTMSGNCIQEYQANYSERPIRAAVEDLYRRCLAQTPALAHE